MSADSSAPYAWRDRCLSAIAFCTDTGYLSDRATADPRNPRSELRVLARPETNHAFVTIKLNGVNSNGLRGVFSKKKAEKLFANSGPFLSFYF